MTEIGEIDWQIKSFNELTTHDLHDILKARVDIFVVEQNCAYPEIDGKDPDCFHVIARDRDDKLIGTARIAPAGVIYDEASVGRVVVVKEFRRLKLGTKLMQLSMDFCENTLAAQSVKIAAQLYLKDFYEEFGFEQISKVYLWDGIEHIDMRWMRQEQI